MDSSLVEVIDLKKHFKVRQGMLHAVDGVSFSIRRGRTLGVVGESGSGKSTLGRTILRLLEPTSGNVYFEGVDITSLTSRQMRHKRLEMQIVFQDPFSSLNPRMTVGQIIEEPMKLHRLIRDKNEGRRRVVELMDTVGLATRLFNSYPHELDGGRRQRIGIARALSVTPKFVVCDEPVSALDVSIQAQILNLMKELQQSLSLTYMFITHDLSVVNHVSDDILVMYSGKVVEIASAETLFGNPTHPYTTALLSAIPVPNLRDRGERVLPKGEITSPINPQSICRFLGRCQCSADACRETEPELLEVEKGHWVACHLSGEEKRMVT